MLESLMMLTVGFLVAILCADAMTTRDAIKRSGGRIVEGNKLMVWFMANDFRAIMITAAETAGVFFVSRFFISLGAWYGVAAFCWPAIVFRGRVVIKNYRLNVRVMES